MERGLTMKNKTCFYCKESIGENLTLKETFSFLKRRIGGIGSYFHDECYEKYIEEAFVEEYKGNKIYKIGEYYYPYLDCPYYFYTLRECKARIDIKGVGFFPYFTFN